MRVLHPADWESGDIDTTSLEHQPNSPASRLVIRGSSFAIEVSMRWLFCLILLKIRGSTGLYHPLSIIYWCKQSRSKEAMSSGKNRFRNPFRNDMHDWLWAPWTFLGLSSLQRNRHRKPRCAMLSTALLSTWDRPIMAHPPAILWEFERNLTESCSKNIEQSSSKCFQYQGPWRQSEEFMGLRRLKSAAPLSNALRLLVELSLCVTTSAHQPLKETARTTLSEDTVA